MSYYGVKLADAMANIEHYRAIGETYISLSGEIEDLDWGRCIEAGAGALHRLEIAVAVSFKFVLAEDGLEPYGTWNFDVETREANATGAYDLKLAEIAKLLSVLQHPAKGEFTEYLGRLAAANEDRASKAQDYAVKQYGQAAALRRTVKP